MLRMLRIIGIVMFALLVGYAANSLYTMYGDGRLFEQYNSQRKASTTILAVSLIALGTLGSVEVRRLSRSTKQRYGQRRYTEQSDAGSENVSSSNIYAAAPAVDEWQDRRVSRSKSRSYRRPLPPMHEIWMKVLRILSFSIPVLYGVVFSLLYTKSIVHLPNEWIYPVICCSYVLTAVVAAVGIFKKKTWGLSVGYLLAILNLVIFPVGTAVGLLLLVCLVGASDAFVKVPRPRKKMSSFG